MSMIRLRLDEKRTSLNRLLAELNFLLNGVFRVNFEISLSIKQLIKYSFLKKDLKINYIKSNFYLKRMRKKKLKSSSY